MTRAKKHYLDPGTESETTLPAQLLQKNEEFLELPESANEEQHDKGKDPQRSFHTDPHQRLSPGALFDNSVLRNDNSGKTRSKTRRLHVGNDDSGNRRPRARSEFLRSARKRNRFPKTTRSSLLKPPLPASRVAKLFRTCFDSEAYPLNIDSSDISPEGPDPIDLTDYINRGTWVASGGFGHVYKGTWKNNILWDITGLKVPQYIAVKVINLPALDEEDKKNKRLKNIQREVQIWSKIDHDNILPLVGIARIDGDSNLPAFVSPWMQDGSVTNFLEKNPSFSSVSFLPQIIKGLHYLHTLTPEIVHGDIKAANVLVNRLGEACLCDFGLSRFVVDNTLWRTTATHANGTVRWMSPELLDGEQIIPTRASDIYAYGMTCYEILCRRIPFESVGNDFAVMAKVLKGTRPERPQTVVCADEIWAVITRCWDQDPKNRPSTESVLALVEGIVKVDEIEDAYSPVP